MSTRGFQRELDLAPTATIDKVALNNKVVLMRAIVRRSKLHLINGLVKKVHKLRDKKGSDAQKKQNKSKADRMLEDIKIIKVLKPDYVSKYALSTTVKFEELAAKTSTTAEMRALARLAAHKFIMQEVDKFRQEHEDWKDLAAYLMTKHTSREFKKKKTKEKMKKVETNILASENLVKKYLGEKLEGRTDLEDEDDEANIDDDIKNDENDINADDDEGEADNGSDEGEEIDEKTGVNASNRRKINENNEESLKTKIMNFSKKNDVLSKTTVKSKDGFIECDDFDKEREDPEVNNSDDDDDDDDDESDDGSDNVNNDKDNTDDEDDDGGDDDDDDDDDDDETKEKVNILDKMKSKIGAKEKDSKKTKNKNKVPIGNKMSNIVPKKSAPIEKVEGEMIVKKLNLAKDFVDEDIPKILLSDNEDKLFKHKKKRKNLFFDTSEDYDSGNHDGDEPEMGNDGDFERGGNEVLENDSRENYERSIQPTMTAFTTCFVGSLKSNDMMGCNDSQFRSNEDWKRIRHEMREQKFGSFRGRGQGPAFRGRGSSNNFISHRGRGFSDGPRGRGFSGGPRGRGFSGGPRGRGHTLRGQGSDGFRGRGGFDANDLTRRGPATKQSDTKKSGGLHPSWEASKKRKQEQKAVLQAFEGKKIKFND